MRRQVLLSAVIILVCSYTASGLEIGLGWGVRADIFLGTVGSSLYFDATYGRASTGLTIYSDATSYAAWWDFSAFARFPFSLGPVALSPLVGAEYEINLIKTDLSGVDLRPTMTADQLSALDRLWLEAGVSVGFLAHMDGRTGIPWSAAIEVLGCYNVLAGANPSAVPFTLKVNLMYGFAIPGKKPS